MTQDEFNQVETLFELSQAQETLEEIKNYLSLPQFKGIFSQDVERLTQVNANLIEEINKINDKVVTEG